VNRPVSIEDIATQLVTQVLAQDNRVQTKGCAVFSKDGKFAPYEFKRHAVGDNDVLIEILGITADIEVIKIQDINEAYERLLKSEVKYRFVIDMASLQA
jgi:hypothetical protein